MADPDNPDLASPSGHSKSRRRKPKQFKNYQVGSQIAQGTCGPVYLCLNADTGEFIVMKEYNVDAGSSPLAAKRMELLYHEINLLRKSRHANIVRYLGTEQRKDRIRVFMEFVPAGTLLKLLTQFGAFDEAVIKQYTRQILGALAHMHSRNIVHGNVSTNHILVSSTGTIKLSGLGAAWRAKAGCTRTFQADIWTVGAMIIEMASGKAPPLICPDAGYLGDDDTGGAAGLAPGAPVPTPASTLDVVRSHLPLSMSEDLAEFVLTCMHPDPSRRPSATALLAHPCMQAAEQRAATPMHSAVPPTPLVMTKLGHIGRSSMASYRASSSRPPLPTNPLSATHHHEPSRLRRGTTGRSEDPHASSEYQDEVWEALGRRPSSKTVSSADDNRSTGRDSVVSTPTMDSTPAAAPNLSEIDPEIAADASVTSSGSGSGSEASVSDSDDDSDGSEEGGNDRLGALGTQFKRFSAAPGARLGSFRFSAHSSSEGGDEFVNGSDSFHGGRTFSNTLLGVQPHFGGESLGGGYSLGGGNTFSSSLFGGAGRVSVNHRHPLHPVSKLRNLGRSDSMASVATVMENELDPLVTSGGWQLFDPLLDRNKLVGVVAKEQLMRKSGADKTGRTQMQHLFISNIKSGEVAASEASSASASAGRCCHGDGRCAAAGCAAGHLELTESTSDDANQTLILRQQSDVEEEAADATSQSAVVGPLITPRLTSASHGSDSSSHLPMISNVSTPIVIDSPSSPDRVRATPPVSTSDLTLPFPSPQCSPPQVSPPAPADVRTEKPKLHLEELPRPSAARTAKRSPFTSLRDLLKGGTRRTSDTENSEAPVDASVHSKKSRARGIAAHPRLAASRLPSTSPLTTSPVPAFEGASASAINDSDYTSGEEGVIEFGATRGARAFSTSGVAGLQVGAGYLRSASCRVNPEAQDGNGSSSSLVTSESQRKPRIMDVFNRITAWGSKRAQSLSATDRMPAQRTSTSSIASSGGASVVAGSESSVTPATTGGSGTHAQQPARARKFSKSDNVGVTSTSETVASSGNAPVASQPFALPSRTPRDSNGSARRPKQLSPMVAREVPMELQSPVIIRPVDAFHSLSGSPEQRFDNLEDIDGFVSAGRTTFDELEGDTDEFLIRRHTMGMLPRSNTSAHPSSAQRKGGGLMSGPLQRLHDVKPRGSSEGSPYLLGIPDDDKHATAVSATTPSSPTSELSSAYPRTQVHDIVVPTSLPGPLAGTPEKTSPIKISPTMKLAPLGVKPFL